MASRDHTIKIDAADGYTINLKALKAMDKVYVSKSGQIDGMVMIDAAGSTTLKIPSLSNSDYNLGITYSDATSESVTLRPLSAPAKPNLYVSSTAGDLAGSVSLSLRQANDETSALVGADNSLIALTGFAQSEDLSTGMTVGDAGLMAVLTYRIVFHNLTTGVIFVKDILATDLASANQTITDANIQNYQELECSVIALSDMGASLSSDPFSAQASDFPDVVGAPSFPSQDGVASGKVKMSVPVPADVSTFSGTSFLSNDPANDWITLTTGENTLKLHIKDASGASRTISPSQPDETQLQGASIDVEVDMALGEIQSFSASWENAVGVSPESPASSIIMCIYKDGEAAPSLTFSSYSQGYPYQNGQTSWAPSISSASTEVIIDTVGPTTYSSGMRSDIEINPFSGLPIISDSYRQTLGDGAVFGNIPGQTLTIDARELTAPTASSAGDAGESVLLEVKVPSTFDNIDFSPYGEQSVIVSSSTTLTNMFTQAGLQDGLADVENGLDVYVKEEYSESGTDLKITLLPEPVAVFAQSKIAKIAVKLDGVEIEEFDGVDLSIENDFLLSGHFVAGVDYGEDSTSRIEVVIKERQQQVVSSDTSVLDLSQIDFTQRDGGDYPPLLGNGLLRKFTDQVVYPNSAYHVDPDQLAYVSPWRTSSAPSSAVLSIDSIHDSALELSVSETIDNGGRQIKSTRVYFYNEDPGTEKQVYLGFKYWQSSSLSSELINAAALSNAVEALKNGDNVVAYAQQSNDDNQYWSDELKSNLVVPWTISSLSVNMDAVAKTLTVTHIAAGRFMTDLWALGLDSHPDPNDGDILKHNTYTATAEVGLRPRAENTITRTVTFTFSSDGDLSKYFVSSSSELGTADFKTNIS